MNRFEQLHALLDQKPRANLGFFPTPLVRLDRLSEQLGVNLYVKRDDFSGMSLFGGNKIRKLDNVKGFVSIFSSVSTLMCHGESYQSILSTMLRLAELVPVFELENLPDDDAAKLCKSTVVCP